MIDKKFIARHRLRFVLGSGIIGVFLYVVNLLTFAKVWEETFNFYGIPTILIYIGLPVVYGFSCWVIGYFYDVKGFWKEESSHSNRELNPEFADMMLDVKNMVQDVKDIKQHLQKK